MIAVTWIIFRKAKQPGWAAIIPFYNLYILTRIADRPGWWILLLFIPFPPSQTVITIILMLDISKKFGYDLPFALGLSFLPFIFAPILVFGKAQYTPAQ